MVKFSVFVTERDYWDLKTRAREEDRPVTYITTRAISRDVDAWRQMRAASLFPSSPLPAPPNVLVDTPVTPAAIREAVREALEAQRRKKP